MLDAHAADIMNRTYARLVQNQDVSGLFGATHVANQDHSEEIAAAIQKFARHLDRPDLLVAPVALITSRHMAMGIQPVHYGHIAEVLLPEIHAALGPDTTEDTRQAWTEAYWYLAELLIAFEKAFHRRAATKGGRNRAA